MSSTYTYFKDTQDKDFNIAAMKKYVEQKTELDRFLEDLISPEIKDKHLTILDACCGIGHLTMSLNQLSPQSQFVGVDVTPYLIQQAEQLGAGYDNINFEVGDVVGLEKKYPKNFDISISWKTLSWLPDYQDMLTSLVGLTKNSIYISSMFYDGDIDFQTKVREYKKEAGVDGFNAFYNVYSLPHFKEFALSLGAKDIQVHDFDINIDLPKPDKDVMGTYTEKLASGRRLQISGAVVMTWKVIKIKLSLLFTFSSEFLMDIVYFCSLEKACLLVGI